MRFYFTRESIESIKASFFPIKHLHIIDSNKIKENFSDITNEEQFNFFVNDEIKTKLLYAANRKKHSTVIYINSELTEEAITNVKELLEEKSNEEFQWTYIFIDKEDRGSPEYSLFDEIIFFPKHKKMRIVECYPIKSPLYYWSNNIPIPKEMKSQVT